METLGFWIKVSPWSVLIDDSSSTLYPAGASISTRYVPSPSGWVKKMPGLAGSETGLPPESRIHRSVKAYPPSNTPLAI